MHCIAKEHKYTFKAPAYVHSFVPYAMSVPIVPIHLLVDNELQWQCMYTQ